MRPPAAILTAALLLAAAGGGRAARAEDPEAVPPERARTVIVPLDHADRHGPVAPLYYELGARFDPARPTVLVVADGQQFHVRRGAIADLQAKEFGDGFNVAGIVGRGANPEFIAAVRGPDGLPDWERVYRVFNSGQWIEDIEAMRADLVGRRGKILLYGVSGGGFLVHQYLARHGDHVRRAFTACPVDPFDEGALGLNSDHFWEEIGAQDPSLQQALTAALERHAADRATLVMTLQRQNFFEPPDRLAEARAKLIHALATGDEESYVGARKDYQVEEVGTFFEAPEGIPIRVREFEIFQPSGSLRRLHAGAGFFPDLENQRNFAQPLLDLLDAGRIPAPAIDRLAPHRWVEP
jgi:pimeloyl-ACP methyl ester carboxylesterase